MSRPEFEAWLGNPGISVSQWLDRIDPSHEWTALGTPRTALPTFCRRPVHGYRRTRWAALEDKTVIDSFWAQIGVRSPGYSVVAVDRLLAQPGYPDSLAWASHPLGFVVAADSTTGYHGDAAGLRWARDPGQLAEGLRQLAAISRRVRIAEFVCGVPCSILGMVTADGVAVFPPVEIVTLGAADGELRFCGSSTRWRPGEPAVTAMAHACRGAGRELARALAYLGIYSVDGILCAEGFLATELNTRHASGLGVRAGLPEFPIYLLNRAVQERLPGFEQLCSVELEELISSAVLSTPSCSLATPVASGVPDGPLVLETSFGSVDCDVVGGRAEIARAPRSTPDGRMGPFCAELSGLLGESRWFCFPEGVCP